MKRLLLLSLLLLLAACGKKEPVRIGFLGGISGRVADLGVAGRNGAMLAVEEANAAGGIDGRPVELVIRDDAQHPDTARAAVADLLRQNLEVIIGPMTSSIAMAVLPQINATHVLLVSPTVTTTQLTGKDDNFLRVIDDTAFYAQKSARFQLQRLRHRTVAAIYDQNNAAYCESWLGDFRREFERLGGRVLFSRSFSSEGEMTFSKLAREALATRPDTVLLIANAMDAALLCQQLRRINPRQPVVASEWASTERFIELAGAAAEGAVIAQFIDRNDGAPRFQRFVQSFRKRFGQDPGFAGLAGYDAARVALEAEAHRSGEKSLKQTILEISTFQGAQQRIRIDRFGDANRSSYVTEVRNGAYLTLE